MDMEEQYDKIYRYCYFRLHQREKAEDITQETFLRFLESRTYQNTGKSLQYLYTIARNLCMDEYRRKTEVPLPGEEAPRVGEYRAGDMEEALVDRLAVRAALEELSWEERELLLLRYVNEVPVSVMCRLFGISRFALYRRIRAVLKSLWEKLGKEDFT